MGEPEPRLGDPEDEARVSTLELFFDLVFVFTITQLTAVLAHEPTAGGLGRVVVMLTVIWWMYGGYAWLTNAVAPDRAAYQILLLGGMAGFLVLSLAIPHAFSGDGVVFGAAYAAIVLIHAGLFTRSQRGESGRSIMLVAPHNLAMAVLLVIGGAIQGSVQYVFWCAALALIAYNSLPDPRGSFDLLPSHFVERHGLVVIVALGESVVAVGIGASGRELSAGMIGVAILGLALSACLWWTYFGERGDERLLRAFRAATGLRRQALALSVFYYWHLLLLLGIVALASALEEGIAHPDAALSAGRALALGGGAALFFVGEALIGRSMAIGPAGWRVAAAVIALATIPLGSWVSALTQLAVLLVGVSACLAAEHRLETRRQGARVGAPVADAGARRV